MDLQHTAAFNAVMTEPALADWDNLKSLFLPPACPRGGGPPCTEVLMQLPSYASLVQASEAIRQADPLAAVRGELYYFLSPAAGEQYPAADMLQANALSQVEAQVGNSKLLQASPPNLCPSLALSKSQLECGMHFAAVWVSLGR